MLIPRSQRVPAAASRVSQRAIALVCLFAIATGVAAQDLSYLTEMPPANRVVADLKSSSTRETAARVSVALGQPMGIIGSLSEGRAQAHRLLPAEAAKYAEYERAGRDLMQAEVAKTDPNCQGNDCEKSMVFRCAQTYAFAPASFRELVDRYFSPEWQTRYRARIQSRSGTLVRDAWALPPGTKTADVLPREDREMCAGTSTGKRGGSMLSAPGVGGGGSSGPGFLSKVGSALSGGGAMAVRTGAGLSNLATFLGVLVWLAYAAFYIRRRRDELPEGVTNFVKFLPGLLYRQSLGITISIIVWLFNNLASGLLVLAVFSVFWMFKTAKVKYLSESKLQKQADAENQQWLQNLGATHEQRVAAIDRLFAERTGTVYASYFGKWKTTSGQQKHRGYIKFAVSRNLASMDAKERGFLRIVELLNSFQNGGDQVAALWRAALVWGDGKDNAGDFQSNGLQSGSSMAVINEAAPYIHLRLDAVINAVLLQLETIKRMQSADPRAKALKAIAAEAGEGLSVSGSSWLKAEAVGDTIFAPSGNPALRIGTFPDGRPLDYSGEGSLLTIAPPGSGKTQCHVFPNLLTWPGSALILDISGDIYEHTSKWRAENVGPVYKFSPLEPATSHCYNPLTFVRSATDYIWEDSRLLAELMIVPSNTTDPFWENEARTVLTAAIAYVCYSRPPENRPMNDVVEVLFGGKPWQDMLTGLRAAVDVRVMTQHATALSTMNEKTLSSVLQTARTSLQALTGERIARVTAKSDWSPADLCAVGPKRPTVYIYMRPNEVDTSTLSLLRVFIGQHMRIIMSVPVPPPNQRPQILVMLDELPRLRNMPPVDEALAIGRKYGLRLWMFAQSVGQLQNAYENADGMIGHCAVRLYMNPSGADGLSEKLSEEIGSIDSLHDGTRKRLVEAADLAGPGFRNQVLVLARETRPARVNKAFAYQDPELKQRMGSL